MYQLSDYAFDLPEVLIAGKPEVNRDTSRLLCLDRNNGNLAHLHFSDIVDLLDPTDLLVVNNTKVIPARLNGHKESGGKVEVLILDYIGGMRKLAEGEAFECECLLKASKRAKTGARLFFNNGIEAEVIDFNDGIYRVRFICGGDFESCLDSTGEMPLPPYIRRNGEPPCNDKEAYQTVYAAEKGAVAAPTAGLHFTENLLDTLKAKGVEVAAITLHVGYGTFVPVRVNDIRDHQIHTERFHISETTADLINRARKEGRRVIAVGTTTVRTLEYAVKHHGQIKPGHGECDLYIYPGYEFEAIDAMITNFHIPESTLLMLVSAFAGRESILNAYDVAVKERYRFYSYGDAMFIS